MFYCVLYTCELQPFFLGGGGQGLIHLYYIYDILRKNIFLQLLQISRGTYLKKYCSGNNW